MVDEESISTLPLRKALVLLDGLYKSQHHKIPHLKQLIQFYVYGDPRVLNDYYRERFGYYCLANPQLQLPFPKYRTFVAYSPALNGSLLQTLLRRKAYVFPPDNQGPWDPVKQPFRVPEILQLQGVPQMHPGRMIGLPDSEIWCRICGGAAHRPYVCPSLCKKPFVNFKC